MALFGSSKAPQQQGSGCVQIVGAAIIGLFAIVIIGGSMRNVNPATPPPEPPPVAQAKSAPRKKTEAVTLGDARWWTDNRGVKHIVGTLTNNTSKTFSFVQAHFDLFDADGNNVGQACSDVSDDDLKPHQTRSFDAVPPGQWKDGGWEPNGSPVSFVVESITSL